MKTNILNLSKVAVMGILNLTEDSFYDGGRYCRKVDWMRRVEEMVSDGVDIIDVGAASTRPGANRIDVYEEIQRLSPVVKYMRQHYPDLAISIDTYHAETAISMVSLGADIINDISAGTMDDKMFSAIAHLQVPYIMMHIRGTPDNMQSNVQYKDLVGEVKQFFQEKIEDLRKRNFDKIVLDPGFGFAKSLTQNYHLMEHLQEFTEFSLPLLVGVSRKSMIYKFLDVSPEDALNGTSALHVVALLKGANVLRVHDVREAKEVVRIVEALKDNE